MKCKLSYSIKVIKNTKCSQKIAKFKCREICGTHQNREINMSRKFHAKR